MIFSLEIVKNFNFFNCEKNWEFKGFTYLNKFVKGFESGTGILRTRVPGGRKFRRAMCVDKLPSSQICNGNNSKRNHLLKKKLFDWSYFIWIYRKSSQSDVRLKRRWCCIQRMANMVSDVSSESPIICAILEEIGQRHRGMRKPMNKQRFIQSFCIMDCIASSGNTENYWLFLTNKRKGQVINFMNAYIEWTNYKEFVLS